MYTVLRPVNVWTRYLPVSSASDHSIDARWFCAQIARFPRNKAHMTLFLEHPSYLVWDLTHLSISLRYFNGVFVERQDSFMVIAQMKGDQPLLLKIQCTYGPRCEKTCLPGLRQSQIQTSLLSYRD